MSLTRASWSQDLDRAIDASPISPTPPAPDDLLGRCLVTPFGGRRYLPDRQTVVVDASLGVCRHLKGRPNVWPICARLPQLPFPPCTFDSIVVPPFTLQTIGDRNANLRELFRVLRPGGRLITAWLAAVDSRPAREEEWRAVVGGLTSVYAVRDGFVEIAREGSDAPGERWVIRFDYESEPGSTAKSNLAAVGESTVCVVEPTRFRGLVAVTTHSTKARG